MNAAPQPIKPVQVAIMFLCSAAFAGGVANHSGLLRGAVAGAFVFGMAPLGLVLPRLVQGLVARGRRALSRINSQ